MLLTSCTSPGTNVNSSSPQGPATGSPPATSAAPESPPSEISLAVGDCLVDLTNDSTNSPVQVPCDQEHRYQVADRILLTEPEFPGAMALADRALADCTLAFTSYIGAAPGFARYLPGYLAPTATDWENPKNRVLTCLVEALNPPITGSAQGDALLFPVKGQCTGPQDVAVTELKIVDCASKHYYEVFAAKKLTMKKAPSDKEFAKLFNEVCVTGFKKFVGIDKNASKYEVTYFAPSTELWDKIGDHRIVCSAGSPSGGLKGSLKGSKK